MKDEYERYKGEIDVGPSDDGIGVMVFMMRKPGGKAEAGFTLRSPRRVDELIRRLIEEQADQWPCHRSPFIEVHHDAAGDDDGEG
jgi:hypothetical protein